MSEETPAWVLRMEKASDAGWRDDVPTGYHCSAFEAHAIAKEWRQQQATIKRLRKKLVSTERALDAYALQLANEALLDEHDPATAADEGGNDD